ncbi:MAG: hypothetical protein R2822_16685 [Spirosomataceae bacterium]
MQGKDKVMLIFLHDTYYINIFFRATKNPQFIYGMFNIINDKNKLTEEQDSIQSSYLMMKKTPTEFKELRFQQISEQNDLIKIEKELEIGVITMVFGHYQRTVLTRENNIKNDLSKIVKLYPRQQSYRRTFWNSACLNSMQYNECEEEIAQISSNQDDNAVERSGKIAALEEKKIFFTSSTE